MLDFLNPLPEAGLSLFPSQVEALQELHASKIGGCLCMGVGSGKTYVSFLAADALGGEETLLFVPPRLLEQSQREYSKLSRSFALKPCDWVKYSQLSLRTWEKTQANLVASAKGKSLVVVFDEAHMLRHKSSARTKRALRLLADLSKVCALKVVVMSGTLLNGVASHYWHLVVSALHDKHWLPMDQRTLTKLDGALLAAQSGRSNYVHARHCEYLNGITDPESNTMRWYVPKDEFLNGYAKAIRATVGSVLSARTDVGATLRIDTWATPRLGQQAAALYRQAELGMHPGGYQLPGPMEIATCLKQLSLGFYYDWEWPGGKDMEWLAARNEWSRLCRHELENHSRPGYDTQMMVAQKVDSMREPDRDKQALCAAWRAWCEVRHKTPPVTKPRWVDDTFLRSVLQEAERSPMIVWYGHSAVAQWLGERGMRVYHAGQDVDEDGKHSVALSIQSHGTGLNLQQFDRQLFTHLPSQSKTWEQAIGRSHRVGQKADEVHVLVPRHTRVVRNSLTKAIEDAQYVQQVSGTGQKLLQATVVFEH